MDFSYGETMRVLWNELFPVLEKLARTEFQVYSGFGYVNIDDEDAAEMEQVEREMERRITDYLRNLLELHIRHGRQVEADYPPPPATDKTVKQRKEVTSHAGQRKRQSERRRTENSNPRRRRAHHPPV